MRISDWSSDVCSSDLGPALEPPVEHAQQPLRLVDVALQRPLVLVVLAGELVEEPDLPEHRPDRRHLEKHPLDRLPARGCVGGDELAGLVGQVHQDRARLEQPQRLPARPARSEEHTSELQSLMCISYAVFCLKKKNINTTQNTQHRTNQKI